MPSTQRNYALCTGLLGWFAVIAQLVILIQIRTTSLTEAIIRFFSYFTIQSNIIVALCFSAYFMRGKWKEFFTRPGTQTAVTVYITVVGAVYNLVLRPIWHPTGFQIPVDELLHTVIPLLTLLFWLRFIPKTSLQWGDAFNWALYPLGYTIFIGVRGAISGFYPYPFINVTELGYPKVLMNGMVLVLVFVFLFLVLIGVAKLLSKQKVTS
ncbi:MAG: hypothetical protein EPO58_11340 [Chitinophagaceae bacterium]|jgi:hypothetical protein|nr:MAG: hypothetical protein EPO58_11340 [Chitinophagaceae bacterium]